MPRFDVIRRQSPITPLRLFLLYSARKESPSPYDLIRSGVFSMTYRMPPSEPRTVDFIRSVISSSALLTFLTSSFL